MKEVYKLLFDQWMEDKHPHFYHITGSIIILSVIGIIISVGLLIFDHALWWKVGIVSLLIMGLNKWLAGVYIVKYINDFNSKKLW